MPYSRRNLKYGRWEELLSEFDLARIRRIPVTEKFRMVEFIKMLAQEAAHLEKTEYKELPQNTEYRKDTTYTMLSYLYTEGVSFYDLKEIVLNYLENYKFSDVYYAKFAIIGIGVMMFYYERDPYTVFNALIILLGQEFLTYNLKLFGYEEAMQTLPEPESIIRYKEYEKIYRKLKYDLLAMNYMAKEEGIEKAELFINEYYGDKKVKLFFTLLHDITDELQYRSYKFLEADATDMDQMILAGIYCILTQKDTIVSHYMMNSRIGKLDHSFEKADRVRQEAYDIYLEMKKKMEEKNA